MKGRKEKVIMGLFNSKKDQEISKLKKINRNKDREINRLKKLCEQKDSFFNEMISDGLRHGSKLASKHMRERKEYLKRK